MGLDSSAARFILYEQLFRIRWLCGFLWSSSVRMRPRSSPVTVHRAVASCAIFAFPFLLSCRSKGGSWGCRCWLTGAVLYVWEFYVILVIAIACVGNRYSVRECLSSSQAHIFDLLPG